MKLGRPKEKKAGPKLAMEPLVDCVFLLLIFFMISNILRVPPPFAVTLPESRARSEFARKRYNVFIDAIGRISVDDKMMPNGDALETFLFTNKDKIETLIIRADKATQHGYVTDVMERANRRGIESIAIAVNEDDYKGNM
ncbi:MAG: biopolymer transporter ExbD [Candidatus Poribacteria bacterium]|nr:biopolymer transporter ExbD [Candidatus Poribacteria bacterium]